MQDDGQRPRQAAAFIADRDPNSHVSVVNSKNFQISGPFLTNQLQKLYNELPLGSDQWFAQRLKQKAMV
jgi:hypothetical protein